MTKELSYKILVERIGFAFFMDTVYEKLPEFCNYCSCIGHSLMNCKRKEVKTDKGKNLEQRIGRDKTTAGTKKTTIYLAKEKINEDKTNTEDIPSFQAEGETSKAQQEEVQ